MQPSQAVDTKLGLMMTLEEIDRRISSGDQVAGFSTGFRDLDLMTGGFHKGNLALVSGATSMGKSALMNNLLMNLVLMHEERNVLCVNLESSIQRWTERLLSAQGRLNSTQLLKGELTEEDQDRLMHASRTINQLGPRVHYLGHPQRSMEALCNEIRERVQEHNIEMIFIDRLDLADLDMTEGEKFKHLKALLLELDLGVVATYPIPDELPGNRPDKRPRASDHQSEVLNVVDLVLSVYRDEYYNPDPELAGKAEILIAKNRNGETGSVMLAWVPQYISFHNLSLE